MTNWNGGSNHEPLLAQQQQQQQQQQLPNVEVYLPRTEFRLGTALVGTIRLLPSLNQLPRDCFTSVAVQIVGKCRIDPRWHNVTSYCKQNNFEQDGDKEDCTVWATNVVDLLQLPERQVGKWRHVRPRPLHIPPDNPELYFTEESLASTGYTEDDGRGDDEDPALILENQQLTFTFRANLSEFLAPTVSLTCCRYYYYVRAHATTCEGLSFIKTIPFTVLSTLREVSKVMQAENEIKRLGSCIAMAHSSGLPCFLSADELYAPQGQTTITNRRSKWDTNTMRVADPSGNPCCVLTVFGGTIMSPGVGDLLLQFDFEEVSSCRLVSACLEGHETALRYYDGKGEYRTRTILLDSNHDFVEPGYTKRVPLLLHLPPDCPITVETDLVRVEVFCRVDISLSTKMGKFTSLGLTLPVRVVHAAKAEEMEEPEDDDSAHSSNELFLRDGQNGVSHTASSIPSFETKDILKELKILSLLLVEKCNLLQENTLHEI